jgi:hypothetical protein
MARNRRGHLAPANAAGQTRRKRRSCCWGGARRRGNRPTIALPARPCEEFAAAQRSPISIVPHFLFISPSHLVVNTVGLGQLAWGFPPPVGSAPHTPNSCPSVGDEAKRAHRQRQESAQVGYVRACHVRWAGGGKLREGRRQCGQRLVTGSGNLRRYASGFGRGKQLRRNWASPSRP